MGRRFPPPLQSSNEIRTLQQFLIKPSLRTDPERDHSLALCKTGGTIGSQKHRESEHLRIPESAPSYRIVEKGALAVLESEFLDSQSLGDMKRQSAQWLREGDQGA